ncbi:MAG: peptide-N-glycosidase F-related protein, partial [Planctomycetota bacterium]
FYKNRGYMMSVSLDYHHGAPALVPTRVVPLWVGTAHYGSAENHFADFFEPRTVEIGKDTTAAMLFVTTTGHSQVGEFTPSKRTITFTPPAAGSEEAPPREPATFANTLWKSDCYLNPNRPQAGTWKYSRAGWAPGDVVRPWWIDLTPHLAGAGSYSLAYAPQPYEFEGEAPPAAEINAASHIVRAYLIEYGTPAAAVTPPSLVIADVKAGSNAATAGIQAGDYLASYNGSLLDSIDDLRAAIAKAAAARLESVPVVIYRGSSRLELSLAPGSMGISLGSR